MRDRHALVELVGFVLWARIIGAVVQYDVSHVAFAIGSAIVAICVFATILDRDRLEVEPPVAIARFRRRV